MTARRSATLLATAAAASAVAVVAGASTAPVFWPTAYAEKHVFDHYVPQGASDVACAGVGPFARQHGVGLFGEFACDIYTDAGDYILAMVPTSAIHWKILNPGDKSPVSGSLSGIAGAGAAHHVALLDPATHQVVLEDQSTWKVVDKGNAFAGWKHADLVLVEPASGSRHLFLLVDKTRVNSSLEADFRGFA